MGVEVECVVVVVLVVLASVILMVLGIVIMMMVLVIVIIMMMLGCATSNKIKSYKYAGRQAGRQEAGNEAKKKVNITKANKNTERHARWQTGRQGVGKAGRLKVRVEQRQTSALPPQGHDGSSIIGLLTETLRLTSIAGTHHKHHHQHTPTR